MFPSGATDRVSANDYALCVWFLRPMDRLDFDAPLQQDMLGDDLEAWLHKTVMVKRAFKECARSAA
nr:hypothetical protein [Brevundimonas diminuta]